MRGKQHDMLFTASWSDLFAPSLLGWQNGQASSIAQINQAVEQVSQVIQTTSSTAEEGAAASEELSGQAELLKQMVNDFRLKKITEDNKALLENLNLDVILAIEKALGRKQPKQNYVAEPPEYLPYSAGYNIDLNDMEFGKY